MACRSLAHWARENKKLLAQTENLLVLDDWTALFSSPALVPSWRNLHVKYFQVVIVDHLHTEGTQVEPHCLENLVTHGAKNFLLSCDCPSVHTSVQPFM